MRNRKSEKSKVFGGIWGFRKSFICLGVRKVDDAKMKLHAEVTPECSRATSAAAHGAHGCCGMAF